jgi:hypothetical protein
MTETIHLFIYMKHPFKTSLGINQLNTTVRSILNEVDLILRIMTSNN